MSCGSVSRESPTIQDDAKTVEILDESEFLSAQENEASIDALAQPKPESSSKFVSFSTENSSEHSTMN